MKNLQIQEIEFTTKIEAQGVAHTLSNPAKMPGQSYGLPAGTACNIGGKLRSKPGSVCEKCYACKGMYNLSVVQAAQQKRLDAITDPQWPAAMIKLIGNGKGAFFQWHDSGDLQGYLHLAKIIYICKKTNRVNHWLPTKEHVLIKKYISMHGAGSIPENLVIRISSPMIDQGPLKTLQGIQTSTVHHEKGPHGMRCRAPLNNGACGSCRACWDGSIANISYGKY